MSTAVAVPALLRLHPDDNVGVATRRIAAGAAVDVSGGGAAVTARERVDMGHKIAPAQIAAGRRSANTGRRSDLRQPTSSREIGSIRTTSSRVR